MALDKEKYNYTDPQKTTSLIVDGTLVVNGQKVSGSPVITTDGQPSSNIYVGTTTPTSPNVGDIWIDNTSGNGIQLLRWRRTLATTTYSLFGTDDNLVTLAYTTGSELVYLNGALLVRGVDYVATNGSTITLQQPAVAGDSVEVIGNPQFSVTNTYTQAQSDSRYVATNTITAKGDIITGTGYNTYSKTGVGTDGYTLTADSSQANGVSWQPSSTFVAGKNKIINGDFGIWQRGTSTTVTNGFCADRWVVAVDGTGGITTTQQSFTPGNTIAGYEPSFYLQSAVTSVGTSTTYFLSQRIEDVRTFAGQTVTLSFWAKADSVRSNVIYFRQVFGTGGSADNYTTFPAITYSTSWQRYSFTLAIPSVSGKTIGTGSYLEPNIRSTVTSGMNIQIWGVQVEAGSVATPFTTASNTFQGELSLCQRYYQRVNNNPSGYGGYGLGSASTTTNVRIDYFFPVQMRTLPSAIDYSTLSSTYAVFDGQNLIIPTAISYNSNESYVNQIHLDLTVSGAVQFRPYKGIFQGSSSGYLGFSAEL